jgi:N-methylhydantoinase A/oxoprolinase/acetone carboxylase beta subunit
VDVSALRSLFEAVYANIFGKAFPEQTIEITNWKLSLSLHHETQGQTIRLCQLESERSLKGLRSAWDPDSQSLVDWPVYDRAGLVFGQQIMGPALIEEAEATCVIGRGDLLLVDEHGNLIVSVGTMRAAP